MTVTDVSPSDQNAIGAKLEGLQDETRVYATRTHDANDSNIGRILCPTHPSQIRSCVSTPVAGKCNDSRIEFISHKSELRLSLTSEDQKNQSSIQSGFHHTEHFFIIEMLDRRRARGASHCTSAAALTNGRVHLTNHLIF
jgi:hypothetical protein